MRSKIFEQPQVAKDFSNVTFLVQKKPENCPSGKSCHLIVVHSTEIYVPLQLNQSPFNVGLPIQLTGFRLEQVAVSPMLWARLERWGRSPATNGNGRDIRTGYAWQSITLVVREISGNY